MKTYEQLVLENEELQKQLDKSHDEYRDAYGQVNKLLMWKSALKIKVNEAINLITPVLESKKLKDEHIVSLLQYQELHDELNKIHNGKK